MGASHTGRSDFQLKPLDALPPKQAQDKTDDMPPLEEARGSGFRV